MSPKLAYIETARSIRPKLEVTGDSILREGDVVVATEHYHCSMYVCAHACTDDHRMVL